MGIVLWILLGMISGWIASIIMRTDSEQGPFGDIVLGVIGAIVGGFIMNFLGQSVVTGFNLYSLLVAVLGAIAVIYMGRLFYR